MARHTEAGICDDIDSEFLHDYRVSLRQLRSLLQLVKGAYGDEETRRLRSYFAKIARATNRLRDLDVYLLARADYENRLPQALRAGLCTMFEDFEAERRQQARRVKRMLRSSDYQTQIDAEASHFDERDLAPGPRAAREIRRRYRRLVKRGRRITPKTADAAVHALRIEAKRLRYLLEIFAALLRDPPLRKVVSRLEGLQDVLGDFNDNAVQREALLDYLHQRRELSTDAAAAVGGLIAVLQHSQSEARSKLGARFRSFDRESTWVWVDALTHAPAQASPTAPSRPVPVEPGP